MAVHIVYNHVDLRKPLTVTSLEYKNAHYFQILNRLLRRMTQRNLRVPAKQVVNATLKVAQQIYTHIHTVSLACIILYRHMCPL